MNEVYDFDTVPVRRSLLRAIETARVNVWKHGSDGGHVLQLLGMLSRLPNPDEEPKP